MHLTNTIKSASLKINKYHLLSATVIFLIALTVTLTNLGVKKEFIGDDAGVGYHFSDTQFDLATHMWDSYTFPGRSNVIATTALGHITAINVLNRIGLSPVLIDRVYYFLFFFISGLGMYFLSFFIGEKIYKKQNAKLSFVSLLAALFYILNNYTMILLSFPPTNYLFSYMLLPWIFLLYLKDYHIGEHFWQKIVFALLFIILLGGNPSNTISITAIIVFYDLFFRGNNKLIHKWKNFLPTLLLILLFSAFIIFPILGNNANPYGEVTSNEVSIDYNSTQTSFSNLLRFRGHPAQDAFIFNTFVQSKKAIVASCLVLLLSLSFLLKKKKSKIEIFLFSIFILSIFFAKAEHEPFSLVNKILYAKVPSFEMYRASYYKFIYFCIFSISILFSISLIWLEEIVSKWNMCKGVKRLLLIAPMILLIFSATPFFRGIVARDIHKTEIPDEYHEINSYFKGLDDDFSILSLPQLPNGLTLDWGSGNYYASGGHPDQFLFERPVWNNGWFLPGNPTSNDLSFYKELIEYTNVRYLILHKDIPEEYSFAVGIEGSPKGETNYKKLNAELISDADFKIISDNKYFKVFELSQTKLIPHIYIPTNIKIDNNSDGIINAISQKDSEHFSAIYLGKQNPSEIESMNNLVVNSAGLTERPELQFEKINSTKYRLKIHNAEGQFPIIFNESYDEGWKIYPSTDDRVSPIEKSILADTRLKANGYANSWIFDTNKDCGNENICTKKPDGSYEIELILEFRPQKIFYLGIIISGVAFLISLGYAIILVAKNRRRFK
ncbi:hypothetical protein A2215_01155 [Candidatus Berkelbacteria bacterium RIFOXYA2_FULL_43_10]|uniref:Membrane protein 6-pyruvoyl-tetrahydropterin synthase-related domain-containing protein n=1 Tax=Candidatus Berkelbacteria bacterium RIFOXYA2_FULL_43_10 TaxID=1797472 RepID=A0A1F5EE68_9BACT|nr:MAG: hypothetical protein A2215_01155 [Candidatus Berkelbacteria bacterium RIFOXYA2_FULL_43_10]